MCIYIYIYIKFVFRYTSIILCAHILSLYTYNWPGNVRELRNLIERIAILSPENSKESILNIVKESFIKEKDLPLRFVASTACFRKEAGSYGKDTKGMIRQHQFYKVELVSIINPNKCLEELNRMTGCAETILQK